ncbi:MAG: ABC transporter substrate-binding protein [Candidatus Paceibacterota bacterium]
MGIFNSIFFSLTRKERILIAVLFLIFTITFFTRVVFAINENSEFVPVEGGSYIEGVVGQPVSINPVISNNTIDYDLSSLVYPKLGEMAENINIEENRAYTVTIPEELTWSDGERLTTDDIIFTINMIQDPEVNSPLSKSWQGIVVERISELQVKFNLPAPYVFFGDNIDKLPIIPSHIFSSIPYSNLRLSSYNLEPISAGPYEFDSFKRRRDGFITEYKFSVNENYYGEKPYIKDLYFKFFENEEALIDAFRKRDIDGFGSLSIVDFSISSANIEVMKMPRYYSIFFNPRSTSALNDVDFREALKSTINKEKLIKNVLKEKAQIITAPSFNENLPTLSIEESREIIRKFKEDQENNELTLEIIIPDVEFIKETAKFIKDSWENVGIDSVDVIVLSSDDFTNTVIRERNYEAVIFGNILENNLDLFPFWHSSQRFYPGLNLSLYSNEDADTLIENIRQTEDFSQRESQFSELVEIINLDSPAVFLFSLPYTYIYNQKLKGFNSSFFNTAENNLVIPSDRFKNIESWYVREARIFIEN